MPEAESSGGAGVRIGDSWRWGMTVVSHLSVTAGGGAHRRAGWAAGEAGLLGLRGPRSGQGRETRGQSGLWLLG
jgi:hypothetical protein